MKNVNLLRQYKTSKTEVSEVQAIKTLDAVHNLGEKLLSIHF